MIRCERRRRSGPNIFAGIPVCEGSTLGRVDGVRKHPSCRASGREKALERKLAESQRGGDGGKGVGVNRIHGAERLEHAVGVTGNAARMGARTWIYWRGGVLAVRGRKSGLGGGIICAGVRDCIPRKQADKEVRSDEGQVDGEDEKSRLGGGGEARGEASEGAAVGRGVGDEAGAGERAVECVTAVGGSGEEQFAAAGERAEQGGLVCEEREAGDGVGEQRLVAAHARGAASGEEEGGEGGGRHGRDGKRAGRPCHTIRRAGCRCHGGGPRRRGSLRAGRRGL